MSICEFFIDGGLVGFHVVEVFVDLVVLQYIRSKQELSFPSIFDNLDEVIDHICFIIFEQINPLIINC